MSWIEMIGADKAAGRLRALYDRIAGPQGQVDNVLAIHGLRPHTLEGHMALYKAVLHHGANGLKRRLKDDGRAAEIRAALENDSLGAAFVRREAAGLVYARKLTRNPAGMEQTDIASLREAGFDDGEILEINQVAAYFAYANRTVLGLGVSHVGEELGLSPGDSADPENWSHG